MMASNRVSPQLLAAITLIVVLGITSVALFIWMAAIHWTDLTGLSVAIIFILLTVAQAGLSFVWWRAPQRRGGEQADEKNPLEAQL
jgi:membrane protein implicated in regulation of membrane protease activity